MNLKKLMALLMAAVLTATLFAACGNSEDSKQNDSPSTDSASNDKVDDNNDNIDDDGDIAEIELMMWTMNTIPTDLKMVEEAINEITREKINTEVKLNIVEMGSYAQQVNLVVSSGENMDLLVTLPGESAHFNAMTSQNQLLGIGSLLEEYAPELLATVPQSWLEGTMINGEVYSVTSYGDKASPLCFVCRTDILEKTGIDPSTLKTAGDFTELFRKVKEVEEAIIPLSGGSKALMTVPYMIDEEGNFFSYDGLGEGNNAIIAIMPGDGATISNRYATEEYVATTNWLNSWYEEGLVDRDLANKDEPQETSIQMGAAFGYFKLISGGSMAKTSVGQTVGHDVTIIEIDDGVIGTGALRKFSWAVPQNSSEPEAAVKFLNLLYTDAEVLNLLTWGIEDVHYQTLEDGTIDFMDGQDADSCGYYIGDTTSIVGNGFLAKVRAGQPVNYREELESINLSASVSEFLGFGMDTTSMENTLTALTSVVEELRPIYGCGINSGDQVPEFVQRLESADVGSYVEEVQRQLDEWLATR